MKTVGMIAALPSELGPLTRGWARSGTGSLAMARGRIGDHEVLAATAGMGAIAVARACEAVLAAGPVDTLLSVGYAGSLSCGLRPPKVCSIREVIDSATGECFLADMLPGPSASTVQPQRLITLDRVANPVDKRRLAEQYQATLVDMEAAAVARIARAHGLKFLCCKAVTDGPNDSLPDFNRFTTAAGQLRVPALLAWTAVHPQYWRGLRRLGQNSRRAAQELSNFVSLSLSGSVN